MYPCHSLVVDMDISSGKQRFFIGHTDKVKLTIQVMHLKYPSKINLYGYSRQDITCLPQVSCLSMNSDGSLLASGQTGSVALVRVWNFSSAQCLALFKTHHSGLHTVG